METGTYQITNIGLKKQSIESEESGMNVIYEKKKKMTFMGSSFTRKGEPLTIQNFT